MRSMPGLTGRRLFAGFIKANDLPDKPIIALLAGSRSQELRYVLPAMLRMVDHFPDYQFVIAGAPSMSDADYAPYLKGREVRILYGQTYRLLSQAKAALVTSYGDPGNGFCVFPKWFVTMVKEVG